MTSGVPGQNPIVRVRAGAPRPMNDEWLLEEGTLNPGGLMTTTLVFMHGRGQEFKNPAELERKWQAGLAAGLIKAGMPQLADVPVVFPFYANLLYQITAQVAQDPIEPEALPAGRDEAGPPHPDLPVDDGTFARV